VLDVANRRLDVLVDDEVLAARRAAWKPSPARYPRGVLAKYRQLVGSAAEGAVCG
jgi:dihydroxy-acid dehydratase